MPEDSWILATQYHDATGAQVPVRYEQCGIDVGACVAEQGVTSEQIDFHPPGRFWPLQLIEAVALTALTSVTLFLGWHRVQRRVI